MQTDNVQHKIHHDSRPYEVANAVAAQRARQKIQDRITKGAAQVESVLYKVQQAIPADYLVPHNRMRFGLKSFGTAGQRPTIDLFSVSEGANEELIGSFEIHPHALDQLAERVDIPKKYMDKLLVENPQLLNRNLLERYQDNRTGKKYLARVVEGKLLGWLSDSFGRFDSRPLLEAFGEACKPFGMRPVEAQHLDTRMYVKMLMPFVFEPVPNEVLAYGIQFRTSDYGDGALDIRAFIERVWCTNDAMCEEVMRRVHIGAKLTHENFSEETLKKQTEMLVSATKDVVRSILDGEAVTAKMELIRAASEKQIHIKDTLDAMRKKSKITVQETDRIREILTTSDVELLPQVTGLPEKGHTTAYRLGQAFGLMARDTELDGRRAMDFEQLAGELIGFKKGKKEEEADASSEIVDAN
jgi:hypothetical protein